ncbi:MAG: PhzF family phenazine biosynthesis protein [Alphaproteobacteria bacterium]|nr:MAG: PhzF family phenazine biosynthesis protein [Alphaproteobacteria bacterium]
MAQEIPIYQVDAFASAVFAGNPAAVCPLDAWLPDAVLQAIAAENNLSETAFFVKSGRAFDLRWFTPACEVDLCGHATLASAYVIATYLEPGCDEVRFNSRSGTLTVTRSDTWYTLDFPALPPERASDDDAVARALGAPPRELWTAMDLMAVFANEAEVRALKPDMARIAALETRGVIATAPGDSCDFVSRFFAPGAGIPEDPVTGSAHCILTPYWAKRLGKARLTARQISPRGGELRVEDRGRRVAISGQVAPYLEGRIRV